MKTQLWRVEGTASSREGFSTRRFIRCLLYVLGFVLGLGACPHEPTFQMRRLNVRVLCPHRKERWEPGYLAEVQGMESLKSAHNLA